MIPPTAYAAISEHDPFETAIIAAMLLTLCFFLWWEIRRRRRLHTQQALALTQEHLQAALWGSGDGLWDWNLNSGEVLRVGVAQMLGFSSNELANTSASLFARLHPDDQQLFLSSVGRHLQGLTEFFEVEYRVQRRDGSWCWMLDRGRLLSRDHKHSPLRLAGTTKDISARRQASEALKVAATVFEHMAESVVVTDAEHRIVKVNVAFETMFGYQQTDILGKSVIDLLSHENASVLFHDIQKKLTQLGRYRIDVWQKRANGSEFITQMDCCHVPAELQTAPLFVYVYTDITERKQHEDELRYLANYDTLTGLPNRQHFHDRLHAAIEEAQINGRRVGILFLDVDHFKHINDSLGHAYGDSLLQQVALRLRQCVFENDIVARLGGDEFTVVVQSVKDDRHLAKVAQKIQFAFRDTFVLHGHDVSVSPSMGISIFPDDGHDASALLRCADLALYKAKGAGRAQYRFFDPDLREHSERRFHMESALRRALERNELELHFQPRIALANGQVAGYEALVRWRSTTLGAVSPDEFIAVAEDIGVINSIGDWVMITACARAAEWHGQQLPARISVNLSARQLQQHGFAQRIHNVLLATNLPAYLLEIEITESLLLSNEPQVKTNLQQIRRMGIRVALDDFGTGYSTFAYVKNHDFDTIKIAREFVKDIGVNRSASAIAIALIEFAHNLNMHVVAEGVENAEQYAFLKQVGCEEVQGFYVGLPSELPAAPLKNQLNIFEVSV